jgi:hypothetical protein
MNLIYISYVLVFTLISLFLILLLNLNPFFKEQNLLKKRRIDLVGTKLKITERISIRFETLFRQTQCSTRKFVIMILISVAGRQASPPQGVWMQS